MQTPASQAPASQPPATQSQPADAAQGGDQSAPDSGGFVFKKQVEEVALHVTVVDKDRKMVTNLAKMPFPSSKTAKFSQSNHSAMKTFQSPWGS